MKVLKTLCTAVSILFVMSSFVFGQQWAENTSNDIYRENGNVGIGTITPQEIFHVFSVNSDIVFDLDNPAARIGTYGEFDLGIVTGRKTSSGSTRIYIENGNGEALRIKSSGNVGIGTTDPKVDLEVAGSINIGHFENNTVGKLQVKGNGANEGVTVWNESGATTFRMWADASTDMGYLTRGNNAENGIAIDVNGNIGIGTTDTQGYKLAVQGTIGSGELVLKNSLNPPDFVFEEDYGLMPLDELEQRIKQNKHLPDIPSGKEMTEHGVKVAEMQMKLLQKVEELTLYVIDLKKENDKLKEKNEVLEKRVSLIENTKN